MTYAKEPCDNICCCCQYEPHKGFKCAAPHLIKREMKIDTIAEHSVCLELLPEKANILDLGVRGFLFYDYMKSLGHNVWGVDIDDLKDGKPYYQVAISDYNGRAGIKRSNDPQATQMTEGDTVLCQTLETFSKSCGIEVWDLVKMDVESSEKEIIMSLTKAPAIQLSVEWHLHLGVYDQNFMRLAEAKLRHLGYGFASHTLTEMHGAGWNYWSSLFILK